MNRIILRCPQCGVKNRVPENRLGDKPVCGKCRTPLPAKQVYRRPVTLTDQTFQQEVLSYKGVVLVDCWAPWCGPCRMVGPIMDQLAAEYAGRLKVGKINMDQNPKTGSAYAIQSIPSMLLFKDGQLVDTLVGALPRQEIERRIRPYL